MQIKELGHVVLYVTDVSKIAAFYKETLGYRQVIKQTGVALFSSGRTHHELLLIEVGGQPIIDHRPKPGLYHIGFKIGDSTEELKAAYRELKEKAVTILGATDHIITHSLYIEDPDGNELELYVDVSNDWKSNPGAILAPPRPLNLE